MHNQKLSKSVGAVGQITWKQAQIAHESAISVNFFETSSQLRIPDRSNHRCMINEACRFSGELGNGDVTSALPSIKDRNKFAGRRNFFHNAQLNTPFAISLQ